MADASKKNRIKRHACLRKTLKGTKDKPRLLVRRTLKYIYAYIIDDESKRTLLQVTSRDKDLNLNIKNKDTRIAAKAVGETLAKKAKNLNITKVIFDRSACPFMGRIKDLADSARKEGLVF